MRRAQVRNLILAPLPFFLPITSGRGCVPTAYVCHSASADSCRRRGARERGEGLPAGTASMGRVCQLAVCGEMLTAPLRQVSPSEA